MKGSARVVCALALLSAVVAATAAALYLVRPSETPRAVALVAFPIAVILAYYGCILHWSTRYTATTTPFSSSPTTSPYRSST